jgi:serine/threonine protein kinase
VSAHPNIVSLLEVHETEESVQLVQELCEGGELFDRIVTLGPYPEKAAAYVACQLIEVLDFLHGQGIAHRDLKPENILLCHPKRCAVRVADFGLTSLRVESEMMRTVCGTWAYSSPEVKALKTPYTEKCDIWSFGVILYILLAGYHPFDPSGTASDTEVCAAIADLRYDFDDPNWHLVSDTAKDLVASCLQYESSRLTARQVLHHRWFAVHCPAGSTSSPFHKVDRRAPKGSKRDRESNVPVHAPAESHKTPTDVDPLLVGAAASAAPHAISVIRQTRTGSGNSLDDQHEYRLTPREHAAAALGGEESPPLGEIGENKSKLARSLSFPRPSSRSIGSQSPSRQASGRRVADGYEPERRRRSTLRRHDDSPDFDQIVAAPDASSVGHRAGSYSQQRTSRAGGSPDAHSVTQTSNPPSIPTDGDVLAREPSPKGSSHLPKASGEFSVPPRDVLSGSDRPDVSDKHILPQLPATPERAVAANFTSPSAGMSARGQDTCRLESGASTENRDLFPTDPILPGPGMDTARPRMGDDPVGQAFAGLGVDADGALTKAYSMASALSSVSPKSALESPSSKRFTDPTSLASAQSTHPELDSSQNRISNLASPSEDRGPQGQVRSLSRQEDAVHRPVLEARGNLTVSKSDRFLGKKREPVLGLAFESRSGSQTPEDAVQSALEETGIARPSDATAAPSEVSGRNTPGIGVRPNKVIPAEKLAQIAGTPVCVTPTKKSSVMPAKAVALASRASLTPDPVASRSTHKRGHRGATPSEPGLSRGQAYFPSDPWLPPSSDSPLHISPRSVDGSLTAPSAEPTPVSAGVEMGAPISQLDLVVPRQKHPLSISAPGVDLTSFGSKDDVEGSRALVSTPRSLPADAGPTPRTE